MKALMSETAVILAGAVAKGAYEAGALEVLAPHAQALNITRLVGASAGALNASVFGVGLRARAEQDVAKKLVHLWSDAATWHNVVDINWRDIFSLTGIATADRVLELMKNAVDGLRFASPREVGVCLVVTALEGNRGKIGRDVATTFEHSVHFQNEDLDTVPDRDRLFRTALGSAAFPVLFAPVEVPGVGACIDGGTVNNAPVRLALWGKSQIQRIIVISPEPLITRPPEPLSGQNLLGHVSEIIINERLYRDLHDAESVNEDLRKLEHLKAEGIPADAIERVKQVLGWRPLNIVQIRPSKPLEGNAFEGFGKPALRAAHIEAGRRAAREMLGALV